MPILEELLSDRKPHYRLNAFGHVPGCVCEKCFPLTERALRRYVPGLLPEVPIDPLILEQEETIRRQREEIQRLRTELQRRPARNKQGESRSVSGYPIVCKVSPND